MSCFLEFLRCVLCCDEGGKREHDEDEVFVRIPSPPRLDPWIPRLGSTPWSYSPVSLPAGSPRSAATVVVGYSSQPVRPRISPDLSIRKPIDERITPFSSACVGPNRQTQTTQSSATSKYSVSSMSSSSVSEKNSVSHIRATSYLDRPKQPPAQTLVSDAPKKSSGSSAPSTFAPLKQRLISPSAPAPPLKSAESVAGLDSSRKQIGEISVKKSSLAPSVLVTRNKSMGPPSTMDPPKKSSGSIAGPDPPKQQPNSPQMDWQPKIRLPTYEIPGSFPKNFEDAIKKNEVPEVLQRPLSPSTYKDYFAALLYAEDYYLEKWSDFLLHGVTLELHEETTSHNSRKSGKTVFFFDQTNAVERIQKEKKIYVAFEIDSIPERRPYLLSRDFVFVQPEGKNVKFKGILSRVVKSTRVLVEFGRDFHSQHSSKRKYDVSFSFNRVCLKRSHQAIEAAMDPLFSNFLFPNPIPGRSRRIIPTSILPSCRDLDAEQISTVCQIISLKGPPPYLVVQLSPTSWQRTAKVILAAIIQIYRSFKHSRILVTAPRNITCDSLMRSLKKEIPDDEMFRANAAFREYEDVPDDILTSSSYEGECFTCPSLQDLCKFKVITSTFVSSFRLCNAGINAGHFTHIFMVDASFATEPEIMITLANLADKKTAVVVSGSLGGRPDRVRADIARGKGLKVSYFERLFAREPYSGNDPMLVARLR